MLLAAIALSEAALTQPSSVMETENILSMLLSLLTVLAVVVLLAWIWKRMMPGAFHASKLMRVLATNHIGSKEKLMLVRVADEVLLLGVTSQQVTTLARYPANAFDEHTLNDAPSQSAAMQLFLQGKNK